MTQEKMAGLEGLTRQPLLLLPNRVYRLWRGGGLLDRLQGRPRPEDGFFPEDWVGSTTLTRLPGRPSEEGLSRVALPDGTTVLLKSLIEAFPEAMLGSAHVKRHGAELGVLCKLLDAAMRLTIQCHPDRDFARRYLHSEFGKTESWLVIGTRAIEGVRPHILFGFREGVTEAEFRRITRAQDVRAQVDALNRVEVEPGEVYLVPAGAPHAIGAGVFVVEVQEPTDFVVNAEAVSGEIRRTEAQCFMGLGFELGMRCFNYRAGMEFVRRNRLLPRPLFESAEGCEERLIGPEDTPCFGVARLTVQGRVTDHDQGHCYIGIVLEGQGELLAAGTQLPLRAGTTYFVPAASEHEAYQAAPGAALSVIKCFPPASDDTA